MTEKGFSVYEVKGGTGRSTREFQLRDSSGRICAVSSTYGKHGGAVDYRESDYRALFNRIANALNKESAMTDAQKEQEAFCICLRNTVSPALAAWAREAFSEGLSLDQVKEKMRLAMAVADQFRG